jgi:hypothetical protein
MMISIEHDCNKFKYFIVEYNSTVLHNKTQIILMEEIRNET